MAGKPRLTPFVLDGVKIIEPFTGRKMIDWYNGCARGSNLTRYDLRIVTLKGGGMTEERPIDYLNCKPIASSKNHDGTFRLVIQIENMLDS